MENSKGTLIVAETGADIPLELVAAYSINIVPMHVAMGNETLDDGKFPIKKFMTTINIQKKYLQQVQQIQKNIKKCLRSFIKSSQRNRYCICATQQ